ncbi:MAG: TetR/AcrR family transcriptional regulator [Lachnospiraceae bacterium]|jgi:AcrR family transcriptional regulator|nr:TetR/AcrR family transcriptional regulator [Lachnospiraceae bacterium]MBQ5560626.1 TetR/AcrR family transcriptional regulator [Lachnospiraceae bacterium]
MQKGKLYLSQALIKMMETKPLEDISIKDLTKKAGVSRMTYYRYFYDKEDILKDYMKYILEEYDKKVEQSTKNPFHSRAHVLESLLFFKQHMAFALCLKKAGMESMLLDALNDYVRKQPAFHEESTMHSYAFYYYAGALFNCYMQWISDGATVPAEELASVIRRI